MELQALHNKIHAMEIKQTEVAGDVSHIKTRIDNGISGTLTKIFSKLDEIVPKVRDNTYWVGKFKQSIWWIATIGLGGGILGIFFFLIRKGLK